MYRRLFSLFIILASLQTHANIIADRAAPKGQRPTVLTASNGVPLVNIRAPNAAGVSRNTYSQFDVNPEGAILNNSLMPVETQLGGWVPGNMWLTHHPAHTILNEVNSVNPSYLRGFVEVAGHPADVIVANPAGIMCDGCGFINTPQLTLTTGTPVFEGDSLKEFRVERGSLSILGKGLDSSGTNYTELLARSIEINALIKTPDELQITSGALTPTTATPLFGIDVAELGGMYAGKIKLIGTEAGLGVRNAGTLSSTSDIIVTADGRLENRGTMMAQGDVRLTTTHAIAAPGVQRAGKIIQMTGSLVSLAGSPETRAPTIHLTARTGELNASHSRLTAQEYLSLQTATKLFTDQAVIQTQALSLTAHDWSNVRGTLFQSGNNPLTIHLAGTLDNRYGHIVTNADQFYLSAHRLNNNQGTLDTLGHLTLTSHELFNREGTVKASGDLALQSTLMSGDGKLLSGGNLGLTLANDYTHRGLLEAGGNLSLTSLGLLTNLGTIRSHQALAIKNHGLVNDAGLLYAKRDLTIDTQGSKLININTDPTGGSDEKRRERIAAGQWDEAGALLLGIRSEGNLSIKAGEVDNASGFMSAKQQFSSEFTTFHNGGVLSGEGNRIQLTGQSLENHRASL